MPKLILLRHLESQWNLENRFTGWVDVPLSFIGIRQTKKIAEKLAGSKITVVYSSPLFRNCDTVVRVLAAARQKYPVFIHLDKGEMKNRGHFIKINKDYLPVYLSQNLNERYYGKLQGLNKFRVIKKYGRERVKLWRRSFNLAPPGGESLKKVYQRAVPFFRRHIEKDLRAKKNVLIIASHNSLRAIIKYLEKITDQEIIKVEMPVGGLREYQLNQSLRLKNKRIF